MKKFVIFTEGRGELIFVRHILIQVIGYDHLSFHCFDLISDRYREVPHRLDNPNASVYYEIINVGTDERVLSAIGEYSEKYINLGFDVIGLRDMYSAQYKKRSNQVDHNVNNYFRTITANYIQRLKNPEKIHFFFAIMELEAWFLGLSNVLERIDSSLTSENIRGQLNIDLANIDPEQSIFHPAVVFAQILRIANINYDKHGREIESYVSRITLDDVTHLANENRCNSFALLLSNIQAGYAEASNHLH